MNNNSDMSKIVLGVTEKVVNTINEHSMIESCTSILVAVSGGADSVCLLHVLDRIKKSNKFTLYAAHVNHQIRGEEADSDEEYVKNLCEDLGIKCFSKSIDVRKIARQQHISEEEAGRNIRYSFFSEICRENKIDYIATAHNKNDQAETVLMRVMRGSGLSGLRGIKYAREDGVVRPLLDVSRSEIEEYLNAFEIDYKTDSTNNDDNYTRNKVRHKLIPLIEGEFNSRIVDNLSGLAKNLDDDGEFIDGYASRLYERLRAPMPNGKFKALHINSLDTVSNPGIIYRLIILCARDEMGSTYSLEKRHVKLILNMFDDSGASSVDLPGGLRVTKKYGWLEFCNTGTDKWKKYEEELSSCNNTDFCVEVIPNKLYNIEKIGASVSISLMNSEAAQSLSSDEIVLDADKLGIVRDFLDKKFYVRNRRAGDRFVIYKNGKSKKLKNLFIDMKIKREERNRVPILCDEDGKILAIIGIRVNEEYKLTPDTKNIMVVHYEKFED